MKDFRNLEIWNKSHQLTLEVYKATKNFPKEELYGLTSQMRKSASSIPNNIAEGCGRGTDAEFHRFLIIAMGSSSELEYQLILANELGYIDSIIYKSLNDDLIKIRKMLNSLIKKVKTDNNC